MSSAFAGDQSPEAAETSGSADLIDAVGTDLVDAVEVAREALVADGAAPGAHLDSAREGDWAAAHYFAADLPGYRGWQWCVVLAGSPGGEAPTVSEIVLLPGQDSLLAPAWVPWAERISGGDLGPGDVLAAEPDDPRLVDNHVDTGDEFRFESEQTDPDDIAGVAGELGLGRKRLLSREGRDEAAQRWYDGDYGPGTPMANSAPASCCTCGFYIPLSGSLRAAFGACANEYAADGRVVSAEYGCGAHSDVVAPKTNHGPIYDAYDDGAVEVVEVKRIVEEAPAAASAPETAEPAPGAASSEGESVEAQTESPAAEVAETETSETEDAAPERTETERTATETSSTETTD